MESFTIRVYGIIIHEQQLCLSRERIQNELYVKFPGGGLEFGEGTKECLQREMLEETEQVIRTGDHFYTTDFFQPSLFHDHPVQVISIYYFAEFLNPQNLKTVSPESKDEGVFWIPINELSPAMLDLPIDKVVAEKMIQS